MRRGGGRGPSRRGGPGRPLNVTPSQKPINAPPPAAVDVPPPAAINVPAAMPINAPPPAVVDVPPPAAINVPAAMPINVPVEEPLDSPPAEPLDSSPAESSDSSPAEPLNSPPAEPLSFPPGQPSSLPPSRHSIPHSDEENDSPRDSTYNYLLPGLPISISPRIFMQENRSEVSIVFASQKVPVKELEEKARIDLNLFCGPLFNYLAEQANYAFYSGFYADGGRFGLDSWARFEFPDENRRPKGGDLLLSAIKFVNLYANEICETLFDWPPKPETLKQQLIPSKALKTQSSWFRALVFGVAPSYGVIQEDPQGWTVDYVIRKLPKGQEIKIKFTYRVAWIIGTVFDGYSYSKNGNGWEFNARDPKPQARPLENFKPVKAMYVCLTPYMAKNGT